MIGKCEKQRRRPVSLRYDLVSGRESDPSSTTTEKREYLFNNLFNKLLFRIESR